MDTNLVLPKHGLEEEHVPVPAEHVPRLKRMYGPEWLCLYEAGNPDASLIAANPIDVER